MFVHSTAELAGSIFQPASTLMLKLLPGVYGLSWNGDVHVEAGKMLCDAAAKSHEVLLNEG